MHTSFPTLLASALLLAPSALAGGQAASDSAGLERGLEAIQEENVRRDIFFLASDEMAGRDTPSPEQEKAARFLRDQLQELGFEPGSRDGYLHQYPLTWRQLLTARCSLRVGETELVLGEDYVLTTSRDGADLTAHGALVSVGEGEKGDLEDHELEGRWLLAAPGGSSLRRLSGRAEEAGAVGVLILPEDGDDVLGKNEAAMRSLTEGQLSRVGDPDVALVALTQAGARKLLAACGVDAQPESGTPLGVEVTETRTLTHPRGYRLFENVAGFWPGSDPELAKEVLIVSAHYDHVGVNRGEIYNGADDNASGTTGLLNLARALKAYGPMRRSVLLLWVSGEEKGLLGSGAWAKRPWLPEGCYPVCDINIDMIGRNAPDDLMITPTKRGIPDEYNGLVRLAEKHAKTEGFGPFRSADEYWRRSDHMNFAVHLKLPVTFLFADVHEDYHQPTDDPHKIDCDKIRRVTRLVLRMLDGLQTDELTLHTRPIPTYEEFAAAMRAGMVQDDLERLRTAAYLWQREHDAWPKNLAQLTGDEVDPPATDPWGHPYRMDVSGGAPVLVCLGSDGREGGEGEAADVRVD